MPFQPAPLTLGFIPANRGFFSSELAAKMRGQTIRGDGDAGGAGGRARRGPDEGRLRPTRATRPSSAELFRRNEVQGIVVGAVNFGDEQAAAWTVRQARLDVPVLIFGCQEEES